MVIGILSVFTFNLVDTYFVGQLGTDELAALTFTFPVVSFLASLSLGLGMGVTSVVARAHGGNDKKLVNKSSTDALSLAFIFVSILAIIGLLTIEPLFSTLGANAETIVDIKRYMQIWYIGMPFIVIPMVGNGIIRATGNFAFPMWVMLIAGLSNIFFDYLLIFGNWGFPRLELEGAAIATVIARAMTLVASSWFLVFRQKVIVNPFRGGEVLRSWKRILKVALPSGLMNIINPSALAVIIAMIAPYGKDVVAGFGVGMRVESFAIIPLFAVSSSLNPIIGQNWGKCLLDRVNHAMVKSFIFSTCWGAVVIIFLYFFSPFIMAQFSNDLAIQQAGINFLKISPMVYLVEGIVMYVAIFFIATGTSYRSMLISLFRFGIFYLPLAYLGGKVYGYQGVFAGKVVSGYMSAIMSYLWWRKKKNKG